MCHIFRNTLIVKKLVFFSFPFFPSLLFSSLLLSSPLFQTLLSDCAQPDISACLPALIARGRVFAAGKGCERPHLSAVWAQAGPCGTGHAGTAYAVRRTLPVSF